MPEDKLSGSVTRVTYYNAENGYCVLRIKPDEDALSQDKEGLVTVTGNLPELVIGEYLQLSGEWVKHPKHGVQFKVDILEQTMPVTLEGIRRYLSSGLLKGVGPAFAERIVSHFGEKTIEIIDKHPERLREVADIGPKRSERILAAWEDQKQVRQVMLFLHSHGVSTNLATKIHKQYGNRSLEIVQRDPYQLARDMYGVGFKTADRIAQSLGLPADHPTRLEAGLIYTLNEFTGEGHVYAPRAELINRAAELLGTQREPIEAAVDRLGFQVAIVIEGEAIYPAALHEAEVSIAKLLRGVLDTKESAMLDLPELRFGLGLLALDQRLSADQQKAVVQSLQHPVSVLTGGPGTGKTTTIRALIAALELSGKKYSLASPTGRAAKRLGQAANRQASTIHRLLGYKGTEGAKYNEENTLPIDMLVVDEASMLDLLLTNSLLKALKPGTHLVLVGDVDQLPSVGAGDVLREIIASEVAPLTRLQMIYRQDEGSQIITNAHRINAGEMPVSSKNTNGDFFVDSTDSAEDAAAKVVTLVSERIPKNFKKDALQDIQVLTPMYRGPAGVSALNAALQDALNPASALKVERSFFGQLLRVGDRVMQVKNDYDKAVFNGDIGLLKGFDMEEQTLTVEFEGRGVIYEWSEADQLTLAYAITVHKAQGSEFPVVVFPVLTQHYVMLQRNLLYTAVTRAQRLCVLVGNKKAIAMAIKNNKVAERWSGLAKRLNPAGLKLKPQHFGVKD